MRSTLLFLLLGGAVVGGGFALDGGSVPEVGTPPRNGIRDIAVLLPDSCALKVVIDGGPFAEHGEELALHALAEEPEVAAFLAPVEQILRGLLEGWESLAKQYLGLTLDETLRLAQYRTTMALCGLMPPPEGQRLPRPDAVITLEFGDDLAMARRLMEALEKAVLAWGNGHFTADTVAGLPVRRYVPDPSRPNTPPAWYLVEDRTLLLATHKPTFEGIIQRLKSGSTEGSLAASARFQSVKERVERGTSLFSAYADVEKLADMLGPMLPIPADQNPASAFGLDAVEAVGYGLDLDGKGLRDRVFMKIAKGPLREAIECTGALRIHEVVPASTGMYGSFQLELSKIWGHAKQVLGKVDPATLESATGGVDALSEALGIDVEKEVLPRLGPEMALGLSRPRQALIPDVFMIMQVREPAKVVRMFDTAMRALDAPIASLEYGDQRIHVLDLGLLSGGATPSIRPTWAFVDDYLVVSAWPQATKNLLDHMSGQGASLAQSDDFKSLLAHLRAEDPEAATTALNYVDMEALVGFLCDNGVPLAQSLLPPTESPPVDWTQFPHTDTITRHLFGLAGGSRWTADGYYAEYWSPTGYLGPYLLSVGFGGYVWARQMEMSAAASAAHAQEVRRRASAVPFEIREGKERKKNDGRGGK